MAVEPITDYLKRRLREAGASTFDDIADKTGVRASFIRKFVYGSRENPRVQTIQPLLDHFSAVDNDKPSRSRGASANDRKRRARA